MNHPTAPHQHDRLGGVCKIDRLSRRIFRSHPNRSCPLVTASIRVFAGRNLHAIVDSDSKTALIALGEANVTTQIPFGQLRIEVRR